MEEKDDANLVGDRYDEIFDAVLSAPESRICSPIKGSQPKVSNCILKKRKEFEENFRGKNVRKKAETTKDRLLEWNYFYSNVKFGIWIQCTECGKWRNSHEYDEEHEVPKDWHCSMNLTGIHTCDEPEDIDNVEFSPVNLIPGSIVWAKVDGYPWWPGMIEDDPDTEEYYWMEKNTLYYNVTFLDERVTRAWVPDYFVRSYLDPPLRSQHLKRKYKKTIHSDLIEAAEKMAEQAMKLSIKERLENFSFAHRYSGKWSSAMIRNMDEYPEDITEMLIKEIEDIESISSLDSDTKTEYSLTSKKMPEDYKNLNKKKLLNKIEQSSIKNEKQINVIDVDSESDRESCKMDLKLKEKAYVKLNYKVERTLPPSLKKFKGSLNNYKTTISKSNSVNNIFKEKSKKDDLLEKNKNGELLKEENGNEVRDKIVSESDEINTSGKVAKDSDTFNNNMDLKTSIASNEKTCKILNTKNTGLKLLTQAKEYNSKCSINRNKSLKLKTVKKTKSEKNNIVVDKIKMKKSTKIPKQKSLKKNMETDKMQVTSEIQLKKNLLKGKEPILVIDANSKNETKQVEKSKKLLGSNKNFHQLSTAINSSKVDKLTIKASFKPPIREKEKDNNEETYTTFSSVGEMIQSSSENKSKMHESTHAKSKTIPMHNHEGLNLNSETNIHLGQEKLLNTNDPRTNEDKNILTEKYELIDEKQKKVPTGTQKQILDILEANLKSPNENKRISKNFTSTEKINDFDESKIEELHKKNIVVNKLVNTKCEKDYKEPKGKNSNTKHENQDKTDVSKSVNKKEGGKQNKNKKLPQKNLNLTGSVASKFKPVIKKDNSNIPKINGFNQNDNEDTSKNKTKIDDEKENCYEREYNSTANTDLEFCILHENSKEKYAIYSKKVFNGEIMQNTENEENLDKNNINLNKLEKGFCLLPGLNGGQSENEDSDPFETE